LNLFLFLYLPVEAQVGLMMLHDQLSYASARGLSTVVAIEATSVEVNNFTCVGIGAMSWMPVNQKLRKTPNK